MHTVPKVVELKTTHLPRTPRHIRVALLGRQTQAVRHPKTRR
jgi:hypothetical protein